MSKKIPAIIITGFWAIACLFFCEQVQAQSAQDLINQMRALRNRSQGQSDAADNRNTGPSARTVAIQSANEQYDKGWDAYNQGDFTAALTYYQNAENIFSYKGYREGIERARAAIENDKGIEARHRGDYTTELDYFQKALAIHNCDRYRKNVTIAKEDIAFAQQQLKAQQAIAAQLQQAQNFGSTLTVAASSPSLGFGDPMVVDTRNVSTGLPESVERSIPQTPAGGNVRKGLEAVQKHDWKTALAWFQTALNKEPGDPGLKRLVDLAQYTLQKQASAPGPIGNGPVEINRALNDYNQNIFSTHPELKERSISEDEFSKEDPAWMQFLGYISAKQPN